MKKAFVTGANKGIGYAIAKYLMQKGWHVLIGARNRELGEQAVARLNQTGAGKAEWLEVDLADLNQIAQCVANVQSAHADLALLVNNAGIPGNMAALSYDTELADIMATVQVNFFGTFALTKGLIPVLAANRGRIVNITIPTDIHPQWNPLAYKASKSAQNTLTEHLALDFEQNDIPVEIFGIFPGPTTTDLNGNMDYPGFHTADDVGGKIADVIEDGQRHHGEFIEIYPVPTW